MAIFWESSTCLSISGSVSFYSRAFPKWFSHLWPSLLPNTYLLLLQAWLQWIRNRLYKFCDEIKISLGFFKIPNLPSSKIIILQKYLNSQHKLKIVCVDNTVKKEKSTTVWLYVRIQLTMAAFYWTLPLHHSTGTLHSHPLREALQQIFISTMMSVTKWREVNNIPDCIAINWFTGRRVWLESF